MSPCSPDRPGLRIRIPHFMRNRKSARHRQSGLTARLASSRERNRSSPDRYSIAAGAGDTAPMTHFSRFLTVPNLLQPAPGVLRHTLPELSEDDACGPPGSRTLSRRRASALAAMDLPRQPRTFIVPADRVTMDHVPERLNFEFSKR